MELLEKRLIVGYRRLDDWTVALQDALVNLAKALDLCKGDVSTLHELPTLLDHLVFAEQVVYLDVGFADAKCRIHFVYEPEDHDEDDLDISLLRLLRVVVDVLDITIVVKDEDYADYLQAGRLLTASTSSVCVRLVPREPSNNDERMSTARIDDPQHEEDSRGDID